jgi:hypothetical protein
VDVLEELELEYSICSLFSNCNSVFDYQHKHLLQLNYFSFPQSDTSFMFTVALCHNRQQSIATRNIDYITCVATPTSATQSMKMGVGVSRLNQLVNSM